MIKKNSQSIMNYLMKFFMNYMLFPLSILLCYVFFANAQSSDNFTGYRDDTTYVASFNADSSGVTKVFNMANFENPVLSVLCDDTSSTGYASDSIKFVWGIQWMNVVMNSSGKKDTSAFFNLVCDTFDILTAANMVYDTITPDTLGNFTIPRQFIDTVNVSGYAAQTYPIFYYTTPLFRFWYEGLTGNKTGSYVPMVFTMNKRKSTYVKGNN